MPGQKKIDCHAFLPSQSFLNAAPFLFFRSSCPFLSCFYISKSFAVLQTFFATQIQLPCAIELPCFKAAKRCFHVLRLKRRTPKHVLTALKPDFASVMQTSSRHSSSRMSEWYARSEKIDCHAFLPSQSFLNAAPFLFFGSSCPFLSCFYISKSFAVLQTFFATQIQLPCAIELPCFKAAKRCFHVLRLKRRTPKHVLTALKPDFASVMQTSSRHSSSRMSEWYARSEKNRKPCPSSLL